MTAALDTEAAARVRATFARQPFTMSSGMRLARIGPGFAEIVLPAREDLLQHHGHVHGGVVSALADTAGGFAAYTLFPEGSEILTVEYKINFLAPARGELVGRGQVTKAGRTLTVTQVEILSGETICAVCQQTLMRLDPRG